MRRVGEKDFCLIVENQNTMKKIILITFALLTFACCSSRLTEKVEARYPNEQPQFVRKYDKSGECVYETEYYESGQVKMQGAMKNGKRQGECQGECQNNGSLDVLHGSPFSSKCRLLT